MDNIEENINYLKEHIQYLNSDLSEYREEDLIKAIENLIKSYEKQKQEKEKWKELYLDKLDKTTDIVLDYNKLKDKVKQLEAKLEFKQYGDLDDLRFEEYMNEFIPKQKIKDLKENIILQPVIVGGRRNGKTLEYGIKLGKIKACEELLQESEDK